jgi:hypothetical protein
MVQDAFGYVSASTTLGAREAVEAALDPVTRQRRLVGPCTHQPHVGMAEPRI